MKQISLLLAIISLTTNIMASPVSKQEAASIAKSFFAQKAPNSTNSLDINPIEATVEMAYESNELYVFNGNGGFVVVSADDKTAPVLGWSDGKPFDAQKVNPAAQEWLKSCKQQIQALKDNGDLEVVTLSDFDPVEPLVPFHWNQSAPYDKYLPIDEKTEKRVLPGCPAIALAQVMATMKYPDGTMPRGIPEQNTYNYEETGRKLTQKLEALPAISFDWSKMGESYEEDDKTDAPNEVAKLVKYAGYAQGMRYTPELSAAWMNSTFEAARLYFGYSEVQHLYRNACTYSVYENALYSELKDGSPVIYSATSVDASLHETVAHTFVIDGYQDGYYHVNWGWGGESDGYFILSVLNSDQKGEKGQNVGYGYNICSSFILGLKKPTTIDPAEGVNTVGIMEVDLMDKESTKLDLIILNRADETQDFPAFIEGVYFDREIAPYIDKEYDIAWNLYDTDKNTYVFTEPKIRMIEAAILSGERKRMTFNVSIPKDVPNGNYQVHWMFRDCKGEKNTDKWYVCHMGDVYCIEMAVEGNTLRAWPSFDEAPREGDLPINSVAIDGEDDVYKSVSLKFTATNNTNSQNPAVCLWVSKDGESYTMINGTGTGIDKGKKGDFYLSFTPEMAGTTYIALLREDVTVFDPNKNILSDEQSQITIKGTSLNLNVINIDKGVEKEKIASEPLLSNCIQGEYYMTTTDEAPCTKTMYIMLIGFDSKQNKYIPNTDPNNPLNIKVVSEFDDEKPVTGKFSYFNLDNSRKYVLAVGELAGDKINVIYLYPTTYMYTPEEPTGISNVNDNGFREAPEHLLELKNDNGKFIKNGKLIIETAKGNYTVAGQRVK